MPGAAQIQASKQASGQAAGSRQQAPAVNLRVSSMAKWAARPLCTWRCRASSRAGSGHSSSPSARNWVLTSSGVTLLYPRHRAYSLMLQPWGLCSVLGSVVWIWGSVLVPL